MTSRSISWDSQSIPWDSATAGGVQVNAAPPPIPHGCICSYTWGGVPGQLVRNGALKSCPADHAAVDGT